MMNQIFDSLKIPNINNIFLKKEPPKETQIFNISEGPLFRNGWLY